MRARSARALRWAVPVLMAAAFALDLIGEDMQHAPIRELLLHWHQRLGLLALVVLLTAIVTDRSAADPSKRATPRWYRVLDRSVEVVRAALHIRLRASAMIVGHLRRNKAAKRREA